MALGILVVAGLLIFSGVGISIFLRGMRKTESYECGEKPIGSPFTLTPSYLRGMIIFILLEAEIVLLFPWMEALSWAPKTVVLLELALLAIFLAMVWLYFRKRGLWSWDVASRKENPIFPSPYQKINDFYKAGKGN
ncbi:MAG: NADH-quinone oxidoreductase subunit A [Bacteroidia bacterium]